LRGIPKSSVTFFVDEIILRKLNEDHKTKARM